MATPAPACKKALADATLRWPNRNRASDGIMGDAAHAKRKSDHNEGNAYDLTHDPANGVDCNVLAEEVKFDPRVTYVIWNSRIYKTRTGKWAKYTGANPHTKHMHVSIKAGSRNDLSSWPWSEIALSPALDQPRPPADGAKAGESVPDVPAKPGEPIVGGRPNDDAKQVTTGSTPTKLAIGGGVLMSAASAAWSYITNHPNIIVIGIICITVLILAFVFRQVILDYARLQLGASPDKYNVR